MKDNKQSEEIINEDDEIIEEAEESQENLEDLIEENKALIQKAEEKEQLEDGVKASKENDKRLIEEARQQDLKDRFAKLHNVNLAGSQLGLSNPALHFDQQILAKKDKSLAEKMMEELEAMDKKCHDDQLFSTNGTSRKIAYQQIDIMLLEAIAEKEAGDDSKMKEYLAQRKEIQEQFPIK